MRPPARARVLGRYLPLAAFAALILLPTAPAIGLAAAMLAVGAVRAARFAIRWRRAPAPRPGAIVLGVDARGRPVALGDDELSAHGLILGASGAGKTTTLVTILSDQIRRGRPVVAIDMKGSPTFARDLAAAAADGGTPDQGLDARRRRALEPARPRQRDRAEGQADRAPSGSPSRTTSARPSATSRRCSRSSASLIPVRAPALAEVVALMDPRRLAATLRKPRRADCASASRTTSPGSRTTS